MTTVRATPTSMLAESAPLWSDPTVPSWVLRLVSHGTVSARAPFGGVQIRTVESASAALVEVTVSGASALPEGAFQALARLAYESIGSALAEMAARHPVRYWNFIPSLHAPLGSGTDRYMVFNAGRHAAIFGESGARNVANLPTATGVGHIGGDLRVACLALPESGRAVENPRQIPAYRYSPRFGPYPPCFSRATEVTLPGETGRALLVGGTASVVGEDSCHARDLARQLDETCTNLGALIESWRPGAVSAGGWMDAIREARVYAPFPPDQIAALVCERLGTRANLEFVVAELCRRELLVEIEAVVVDPIGDQ